MGSPPIPYAMALSAGNHMSVSRRTVILILAIAMAGRVTAADADLSTPQAAIRTLATAVAAQDADGVSAALYAADEAERSLAKAFAELLVAGRKLNEAARAKFGTEGNAVG